MDRNIARAVEFVKGELDHAEAGHDWWHIQRVWNNALKISDAQEVDDLVIELAALLHDIGDAKFHGGDESVGPAKVEDFLNTLPLDSPRKEHIIQIVRYISFKGGHNEGKFDSPEFRIVQDADRLDAIGAIGIARAFSYGGHKGRIFYDPDIPPNMNMDREEYKSSTTPTINHFYEKLLLLKDLMKTEKGKELAQERHRFMEQYLDQFYKEWS
jgi:uncharacterized protein